MIRVYSPASPPPPHRFTPTWSWKPTKNGRARSTTLLFMRALGDSMSKLDISHLLSELGLLLTDSFHQPQAFPLRLLLYLGRELGHAESKGILIQILQILRLSKTNKGTRHARAGEENPWQMTPMLPSKSSGRGCRHIFLTKPNNLTPINR